MHPLRQARWIWPAASILLVAPIAWCFYRPVGGGLDVTGHPIGRDFINMWVGPQLAFDGRLMTLFDLRAYHAAIGELFGAPLPFHNWGYPSFTLLWFAPLSAMPYGLALLVWSVGLLAAFVGVTLHVVDRQQRGPALALLLAAPAVLINLLGGQNGFLSGALLLGGLLSMDKRPVVAGVLFGCLTFKPHLGVVLGLALLVLRAWRVIGVAVVTAALLVALSLIVFGLEPWRQYFGETSAFQLSLLQRFDGFYTTMMASVLASARVFGLPFPAAAAIQVVVAVLVLAVTAVAIRRTADPIARSAVIVSATLLVTPYAFNYDFTALTAVVVWMLCARAAPTETARTALGFAYLAPILTMDLNALGIGIAPLAPAAVFALGISAAWRAPAQASAATAPALRAGAQGAAAAGAV